MELHNPPPSTCLAGFLPTKRMAALQRRRAKRPNRASAIIRQRVAAERRSAALRQKWLTVLKHDNHVKSVVANKAWALRNKKVVLERSLSHRQHRRALENLKKAQHFNARVSIVNARKAQAETEFKMAAAASYMTLADWLPRRISRRLMALQRARKSRRQSLSGRMSHAKARRRYFLFKKATKASKLILRRNRKSTFRAWEDKAARDHAIVLNHVSQVNAFLQRETALLNRCTKLQQHSTWGVAVQLNKLLQEEDYRRKTVDALARRFGNCSQDLIATDVSVHPVAAVGVV